MKAIRFQPPGGPEKLTYVEEPIPGPLHPDHVLIEVHAVGIIWTELYWPIYQDANGNYPTHIPGHDFSGIVKEVGSNVTNKEIQPGAEVMAFTTDRSVEGAMAEFALAPQNFVVPKPRNFSFVEAASVPLTALTAWQAFYDKAGLKPGQKVLVTGAAGGTGIFAVQVAKHIGATVIGTASNPGNFESLKSLGIDQIVNYKTADLQDAVSDVDVVLDTVGGKVLEQCFKVVKKDGLIININDPTVGDRAAKLGLKALFFIVSMNAEQLKEITGLLEDGTFRTIVESTYLFEEVHKAWEYCQAGHVHGKVLLKVR